MENGKRPSLARIPLRWMIKECLNLDIGINFHEHMLKNEIGLDVASDNTAPESTPRPSPPPDLLLPATRHLDSGPPKVEAQEELDDARSPIYDQFKASLFWRIAWTGVDWFPCGFPPSPSESGLMQCPKGSSKSQTPSWKIRTTLDPTNRCESHHFVTPHRQRAIPLIMLNFSWNRGRGRIVPPWVMERGMMVHRSVKTRMEGDKAYLPKIRCRIDGKVRRPRRDEWLREEFFKWVD